MEHILTTGSSAPSTSTRPSTRVALAFVLVAGLLGGCAANNPQDPLGPYNRAMFTINRKVDKVVLKPVATGYKNVVPTPMRRGVTNFFGNLGDVWSMANDFAQGHVVEGLNGFMRVGVNTVFGFFGVLDISTEMGLYKQPNDFGLTLARYGVGAGPYFVMPLLGPSTIRDALGTGVGIYYAPSNYATNDVAVRNGASALQLVNARANLLSTTDLLQQIALDPYIFTRDAYLQQRNAQVKDVRSEGVLSPGPADEDGEYSRGGKSATADKAPDSRLPPHAAASQAAQRPRLPASKPVRTALTARP